MSDGRCPKRIVTALVGSKLYTGFGRHGKPSLQGWTPKRPYRGSPIMLHEHGFHSQAGPSSAPANNHSLSRRVGRAGRNIPHEQTFSSTVRLPDVAACTPSSHASLACAPLGRRCSVSSSCLVCRMPCPRNIPRIPCDLKGCMISKRNNTSQQENRP